MSSKDVLCLCHLHTLHAINSNTLQNAYTQNVQYAKIWERGNHWR